MLIQSLLDTDLYKFTMMQAVLHQFPAAQVEYRFHCRNEAVDLRPIQQALEVEIAHLCSLRFSEDELAYLGSLRYIKPDFIEFSCFNYSSYTPVMAMQFRTIALVTS